MLCKYTMRDNLPTAPVYMLAVFLIIIMLLCAPVSVAQSTASNGSTKEASITTIRQLTVNDYLQAARSQGLKPNRLIDEMSPYLLQHAYNPVDWYPWGDEAFARARKENKPIFLSIGYSTCHWCHVMAHESFENENIAALINKHFIAIKVDREQRPDIDAVYLLATEVISGHGGWPMTVFLDHQLRPFHAATYYPPFSEGERKGLHEILLKVTELWRQQPDTLETVASSVTARIADLADDTSQEKQLDTGIVQLALQQIARRFDEEAGGFSAAPKFPQPGIFALLSSLSVESGSEAKNMMKVTLDAMAAGGIYDQVAGGFHRYAVDADWQVPHFEKMLYNQALMIMAYAEFYLIDPEPRYRDIIYQTFEFVRQEMRSPQGGYYSALDADSILLDKTGGVTSKRAEGAYYLWREKDIKALLEDDEFAFIKQYFHLQAEGNIFSDPKDEFSGLNILYVDEDYRDIDLTSKQQRWLSTAREKLDLARRHRPRPQLDDKVITAWNGMLLSAYARAAVILDDENLSADAEQLAAFMRKHLYDGRSGRLLRSHREAAKVDDQQGDALLVDYVWLINGLLALYQTSDDSFWLDWAESLLASQDKHFLDADSGVYFESAVDDANILFRSRSITDGALPSANAVALLNLRTLSNLVKSDADKRTYAEKADQLVSSFSAQVNQQPVEASMLLSVEQRFK